MFDCTLFEAECGGSHRWSGVDRSGRREARCAFALAFEEGSELDDRAHQRCGKTTGVDRDLDQRLRSRSGGASGSATSRRRAVASSRAGKGDSAHDVSGIAGLVVVCQRDFGRVPSRRRTRLLPAYCVVTEEQERGGEPRRGSQILRASAGSWLGAIGSPRRLRLPRVRSLGVRALDEPHGEAIGRREHRDFGDCLVDDVQAVCVVWVAERVAGQ